MNHGINFNNNWSNKEMQKMAKLFIDNYSKQLGREIPFEQSEISEPSQPTPQEYKEQWLKEQQDDIINQTKEKEEN
jgi:23S rRNA pseudoU1915 N3-methylase RlmH|tara:strand:- start:3737 stop:3964 length:228 start_codon:yes stop_codon:yes gene_type:complete